MYKRNIKVRVTPENTAKVQRSLFKDGCSWEYSGATIHKDRPFLFVSEFGCIKWNDDEGIFNRDICEEVSAEEILSWKESKNNLQTKQ